MDTLNMFVKNEDVLFRTPSYVEKPKKDVVNHPSHYTQGEIECIEVIRYINDKIHTEGYKGYCLGNFIKYIWRCNFKNGWEDIDKAIFYLNELLTEQTNENTCSM